MFADCDIEDEYKPKFLMYESFGFDKVNKQKKGVNVCDIIRK